MFSRALSRPSSLFCLAILGLIVVVTGCGSSGGGGSLSPGGGGAPATTMITEYYDAPANTQKKAEGLAYPGSGGAMIRTGAWIEYFASPANTKQWDRTYANGSIDLAQPWTEWNADGSIRDDHNDE